jgi:hypothetical protein
VGKAHPEQPVEADEVIHVRVRHAHVRHLQELARREPADVAQIEEQTSPAAPQQDVQRGVTEEGIDQARREALAHSGHPACICIVV